VRTVLECLGEDPDREGLLRTPERYAQALMWMTKGYEDRLAGSYPHFAILAPQTLNTEIFSMQT
jgi:GTP cyclohydrolase I